MKQEEVLDNGSARTTFYSIGQTGKQTHLNPSDWQGPQRGESADDPPGLRGGTLLVIGHDVRVHDPAITLQIDCDEQKVQALQRAILEWDDGKAQGKALPQVPATLKLRWAIPGKKPITLWQDFRMLSASAGETRYEYMPPFLSLAVLSPTGKTLLVGLTAGDDEEYHVIVMRAGAPVKPQPAASK